MLLCLADGLEHDGRLADAGLALDQQPGRPAWQLIEEARNCRRLARTPNDLGHTCTLNVPVIERHEVGRPAVPEAYTRDSKIET
jgi:hypothetical protein